jgi:hypothetical protein
MTTESLAEDWFCRAFIEAFFPILLRKASTAERLSPQEKATSDDANDCT